MLTQMNFYHNKKVKVSIENVSKTYKDIEVLKDISIDVYEGEFVSILGPSGCGKSTIFNIITKLTDYDSGKVNINGKYSYMYQKDLLLPYKTIIDNVSLPLILKKEKKSKARSMVKPYFEVFGLSGYEDKYPSELSGGMRQRANFLRTFINSNDIMLLDEPFGALDSLTKTSMQKWLLDLTKEINSTILLITHDIEEAILLSNRIYIISEKPAIIKGEIKVNLPKERNEDIVTSDKFVAIKKEVLELM